MLRTSRIFIAIVICFCLIGAVLAETKFSYDGQIRLREELDFKSFAAERHGKTFADLRTRVGLKFEPTDKALAYIQFQDSRRLGDPSSGDLSATDNVDLHQAYFELHQVIWEWLYLKAGRFEVNYGNQRVFGAVGWHNVGRSWEGGITSIRPENAQIDLFWLKKMEMNSENYNRDFDIVGIYGMFKKYNLDLFGFYELDADSNNYYQQKLKRFNVGGYYHRSMENIYFTLQGNFQFGEMPQGTLPDTTLVQDISAFMLNGELGYNFEGKGKVYAGVGIDYTSGDDGADSTKFKAYANDYYTGHKFRGYMDYFVPSPEHGLIDAMFRVKGSPAPDWWLGCDFHYFKAAQNYLSKSASPTLTSNIGFEVDLTVKTKVISGATLSGGMSLFIADEYYTFAGPDRNTGMWLYTMTTIDF
ncbi:MAG: alginate export family protein [candidate division Zixibacteria bacterium]